MTVLTGPEQSRRREITILGSVATANAMLWVVLLLLTARFPFLFTLGILAWVFGLRHAADADHLAAIDNTTRKLIQDGRRPVSVGLYFSLGHSTIVFLLSLCIALGAGAARASLPGLAAVGAVVGVCVSATFMFLIAGLNAVILRDLYQVFGEVRAPGSRRNAASLGDDLAPQGLMNRVLGRFYRTIHAEWQLYPVGVLFGLGFDTASEVALLAISAVAVGRGMPVVAVLILPLLFAAGMGLVDTLDGVLMQHAYGWALYNPIRRVYYNLTITGMSVVIALGVGSMELLQVVGNLFRLGGGFWLSLRGLSLSSLGLFIGAVLLLGWACSVALYKRKGWDKIMTAEEAQGAAGEST